MIQIPIESKGMTTIFAVLLLKKTLLRPSFELRRGHKTVL